MHSRALERGRAREGEGEGERESDSEGERERVSCVCEREILLLVLMIVGPTKSYRFNRSDRLLIPVGLVQPELTKKIYLVVYHVSLKVIAVIKFNYR